MPRHTQVKKLTDIDALRAHLDSLGVEIPVDADVDPVGVLAAPMTITDGYREPGKRSSCDGRTMFRFGGWALSVAVQVFL